MDRGCFLKQLILSLTDKPDIVIIDDLVAVFDFVKSINYTGARGSLRTHVIRHQVLKERYFYAFTREDVLRGVEELAKEGHFEVIKPKTEWRRRRWSHAE